MTRPPTDAPCWRRWAVGTYLTIRVSTLGFTLLLPLSGAASAAPGWRAGEVAWLLALALAFHVFAYVFNDVVDLRVDRTEPLRASSPLVRGAISRTQALVLAWAQLPIAFALALAGGARAPLLGWLALAFGALALYDLYGKRCPWPLLTDAVQSVGWCALLLMGAWASAGEASAATWWLAAYVFLCVLLVNGVHGGLRDLANDSRCGARTTAVWLGARAGAGTAIVLSPALVAYALALQAGLVACALGACRATTSGSDHALARGLVAAALAAACVSLAVAFGRVGERRALVAAGAWNIVATLLVLPPAVLPRLGWAGGAVLLAVFALPVIAMWAYNGSHWRLAARGEPVR